MTRLKTRILAATLPILHVGWILMASRSLASDAGCGKPLVPPGLAAVRIVAADEPTARRWLEAIERTDAPKRVILCRTADLRGTDEADVVALYVALTADDPGRASRLLTPFAQGHHGALVRVDPVMVAALGRSRVSADLLARVVALAAKLRGEVKPGDWAPLTVDDLAKISEVCRASRLRPVFLHLSE
jgi:hypothetical protein